MYECTFGKNIELLQHLYSNIVIIILRFPRRETRSLESLRFVVKVRKITPLDLHRIYYTYCIFKTTCD
jgi:hypothetical protein